MGFFHSSSSKTQHHRSKSRFSFRLHSHSHSSEDQDDRNRAGTGTSSHSRHGSRSSTAKTKTSLAQRSPSLHKQAPLPPTLALASTKGMNDESGASSFSTALPTADPLASTFVSSVSTSSDSWSASSPSILKCAVHCDDDAADAAGKPSASSLSTKPSNESLESSSASETEDSEGSTSAPTSTAKPQRAISRVEDQSSSRETLSLSSSGVHNPLAGYRQLHCSMSYKNRQHVMSEDGIRLSRDSMRVSRLSSSFISSHASNYTPSVPSPSSQPESLRPSETLLRNSSMRSMHSVPESEREVEEAVEVDVDADVEDAVDDSTETKRERLSSVESAASNSSRPSEKVTEASVLAMQARRAFQQMALEMEDEESEEEDDEGYDSRQSSDSIVIRMNPRIVKLGADEYRKFQFRLRQLEDLTQEQARKQAAMEVTIEEEVQARTRQVTEAMEKKIAMYKRAKDLECEREIERRTMPSERESAMSGFSSRPSVRDTIMTPSSFNSQDASRQSRTFEKIMHPRRTRRRLEMLKQREEQTKQEMEQFREFLRTTESYVRQTEVGLNGSMPNTADARAKAESARQSLKALNDPHISEDLLLASQNELIEMICILRSHVSVQEEQLEEAKHLIEVAIAARDEAEATAQEAVELTMQLDSELQRTSQQLGEHLNGEHDHENPAWAMDRDSSSSSLLGSSQATLRTPSSSTQSSTAQF